MKNNGHIVFGVATLAAYWVGSFTYWSFDPLKWPQQYRAVVAITPWIVLLTYLWFKYIEHPKK